LAEEMGLGKTCRFWITTDRQDPSLVLPSFAALNWRRKPSVLLRSWKCFRSMDRIGVLG